MSPRRAKNNQRRTLTKQGLIAETNSEISTVTAGAGTVKHLNLSIPVHGDPTGIVVKGCSATGPETATAPTVTSPTQIDASFATAPLVVWIDNAGGLRTASNGTVSPKPATV